MSFDFYFSVVEPAFWRWNGELIERKTLLVKAARVVARWKRKACAAGVNKWRAHAAQKMRERALMTKIVKRLQNRGISLDVGMWVLHLQEMKLESCNEQRRQKLMRKLIGRMRNVATAAAFAQWDCNVKARQRIVIQTRRLLMIDSVDH